MTPFWRGVARSLDLFGLLRRRPERKDALTDAAAIRSDWQAVGDDLRAALGMADAEAAAVDAALRSATHGHFEEVRRSRAGADPPRPPRIIAPWTDDPTSTGRLPSCGRPVVPDRYRGGAIALSWGDYGGFYWFRGYTLRLCLGWIAITYFPRDLDVLLGVGEPVRPATDGAEEAPERGLSASHAVRSAYKETPLPPGIGPSIADAVKLREEVR